MKKSLSCFFTLIASMIAAPAMAFTIGTQNLMHYPTQLEQRVQTFADAFKAGDVPDIIGFQEAAYWGTYSLYGSFAKFSGYQGIYQDTNNFVVVNDGIALLTRFQAHDLVSIKLPDTTPFSKQYFVAGIVETEIGPVGIVAAHFSPRGDGQKIQAQAVLAQVAKAFSQIPVIIVGDLNSTPKSDAMQVFRDAGYSDALNWEQNTFVPHVNPLNHDKGKALRLDYILYRTDQLRLVGASLMFQSDPISDHYGLKAQFDRQ